MSNPTNLPPSVAELFNDRIAELTKERESYTPDSRERWQCNAVLAELKALRPELAVVLNAADPAPVADEAAIFATLEMHDSDCALHNAPALPIAACNCSKDPYAALARLREAANSNDLAKERAAAEVVVSGLQQREKMALMRARLPASDDAKLRKLRAMFSDNHANCRARRDSYAGDDRIVDECMRTRVEVWEHAVAVVDKLLAESPADDAVTASTQSGWWHAAEKECVQLRARLQAAETERDEAVRERDDMRLNEAEIRASLAAWCSKARKSDLRARQVEADLAEARRERDEAKLNREGWIHDCRDLEKQLAAAKAESAKAAKEELQSLLLWAELDDDWGDLSGNQVYRKLGKKLRDRIGELRTAQTKPATTRDREKTDEEWLNAPLTDQERASTNLVSQAKCNNRKVNFVDGMQELSRVYEPLEDSTPISEEFRECQKDDKEEEQIAKVAIGNIQESCKELLNKIDNLSKDIDNLIKSRALKAKP